MVFQICFNFAILVSSSFKYSSISFCFFSSSFLSFSLLICLPVGFKMFGQPALFHIPLANVAEYFLLIIIYCVTLLLFVQAFNTHSIHSIELVTIFIILTLCAGSTLHTIIRYYPFKCISLYHKNYIIQIVFPKNHHRFHITFFYSFPSSVSLPPTLLRICKKILYLKIMSMQLSTYSSPFWLLVKGSMLGSCLTSPAPITIK